MKRKPGKNDDPYEEMSMKRRSGIICLVIMALLMTVLSKSNAEAADQSAKLKDFFDNNRLYYSTSVVSLNAEHRSNLNAFENRYKGNYVTLSGDISYNSVSKNYKEVYIYSDGERVLAKTSDKAILTLARRLKVGDRFTVYGKVESIKKDSYVINVEKAVINSEKTMAVNKYVYFENDSIGTLQYRDLTSDGHIVMNVPDKWNNNYVRGALTNNDVKGYQFFLNAIAPQNKEYAEIFYVFYFDYQTYLDPTYEKYTDGDREDIEELIIKNIVGTPETKLDVEADDIKINGREYDYCSTRYTVNGKTYKLEFVFKADSNKGLICMLYLYYPREGASGHLEEAAYVVGTMEN